MSVEGLDLEISDGVATLTLDRSEKRNAVTYEMWQGIAAICDRLATDPDVRLLVVRGSGAHFCAGADIGGMAGVDPADYRAANEAADEALAKFPKPTLAVITGACVGGGTEIAVACDIRIADTTARFGVTPARLGIVYPAPATERLVLAIGASAAKHLLYTAELIDADHALRVGLVGEVHEPGALPGRADDLADLIARRRSLLTQMASKEIVAAAEDGSGVAETGRRWAAEVAASDDPAEGIGAFLERRDPNFTWTPGSAGDGSTPAAEL